VTLLSRRHRKLHRRTQWIQKDILNFIYITSYFISEFCYRLKLLLKTASTGAATYRYLISEDDST